METFHAIGCLTCKYTITWSAFQVISPFTNHPCYYSLPISKLIQGCIFQDLTGRQTKVYLSVVSFAGTIIAELNLRTQGTQHHGLHVGYGEAIGAKVTQYLKMKYSFKEAADKLWEAWVVRIIPGLF